MASRTSWPRLSRVCERRLVCDEGIGATRMISGIGLRQGGSGDMSMPKPIPEGYHSVTPYLIVDDADAAIDFYERRSAPPRSSAHADGRPRSAMPRSRSATASSCWPTNSPTWAIWARRAGAARPRASCSMSKTSTRPSTRRSTPARPSSGRWRTSSGATAWVAAGSVRAPVEPGHPCRGRSAGGNAAADGAVQLPPEAGGACLTIK